MQVSKSRDLLCARQRARQVASLLGFGPDRQAAIAAEVFACLRSGYRPGRRATIVFLVAAGCLRIEIAGQYFATALPKMLAQAVEDVAWMMGELDRDVPFRVMDEIDAQNRELLAAARLAAENSFAAAAPSGPLRINDPAA
jgi:hypothetical protein